MAAEINTMPYNRDAEMALLGCLLIDNDIAAELVEKLTEDDFYQESHKFVIHAMQVVFNDRKPIDLVTLSDELDGEGNLEKAGGIAYLTELAQITPSAANYKSYYEIVSRDSTNRKLIRASRKIIENCMTGADGRDAISFAEKAVYDISKQADRSSLAGMSEGDIVQQVLQKFEAIQSDANAFKGIQVCVIYLIFSAGVRMLKALDKSPFATGVLAAVMLVMVGLSLAGVSVSSILLILLSGAAGVAAWLIGRRKEGK